MYNNYAIRCMVNGNPSLFSIATGTNVHLYVDMIGDKDVSFSYGSISIPIENAKNYLSYQELPRIELDRYLHRLLTKVMEAHSKAAVQLLDICEIQCQTLDAYWEHWLSCGYVHPEDPVPALLICYKRKKKSK